VLILLFILTIVKTALNISILHFLRLPWSQAFLSGVILAQLGEFAFLLATVGYEAHVINESGQKLIICLTVLSLTFSPLWLTTARRLKSIADNNGIGLSSLLNVLYGQQIQNVLRMYQDFMYPPKKDPTDRPPNASA
ncbi:MAG: cation:proton antiporter, partial [Proteobacteria bacterium]|nr:cation:proton antiporter [Pseudomonadota bacterium]